MWADSIGAVCDSGSAAGTGRGKGRRAARYSGRATWKGAKGGADDSSQQACVEINQQTVDAAVARRKRLEKMKKRTNKKKN